MSADEVENRLDLDVRRGVRAVTTAAEVLYALADIAKPAPLGEVARVAKLAPGKAHRYLASLTEAGLAEQREDGAYRLAYGALRIGISAMRQTDIVEASAATLERVRDRTGFSCFCAVLGNRGATILRQSEATNSVLVNVRPGSVLPLASSATGRVFCAHLSEEVLLPLLVRETGLPAEGARALRQRIAEEVSGEGMARIDGMLLSGIAAIAVPVFDHRETLAGVLTALGPSGAFNHRRDGAVAEAMAEAGREVSARLGWASGR